MQLVSILLKHEKSFFFFLSVQMHTYKSSHDMFDHAADSPLASTFLLSSISYCSSKKASNSIFYFLFFFLPITWEQTQEKGRESLQFWQESRWFIFWGNVEV